MAGNYSIVPCAPSNYRFKDLTGRRFGKLTVIRFAGQKRSGKKQRTKYVWECLCDCTRTHIVSTADLTMGETKSCGCEKAPYKLLGRLRLTERNRLFVDSILRQCPCIACGEADYRCLEFHHINEDGKGRQISAVIMFSRRRLLAEIAKCEIRCKNCHLKVHAKDGVVRFRKGKSKPGIPPLRPLSDKVDPRRREYMRQFKKDRPELAEQNRLYQRERYRRNKATVDRLKAERGCERCGETDPVCLQWHHRDQRQTVRTIASFCGFSWKKLMGEIAKCDVVCGNCHCKEHYEERRLEQWMKKRRFRQLELPFAAL